MGNFKIDKIFQIGIVVKDVAGKIENYKKLLGIDESKMLIMNTSVNDLDFKNKRYLEKYVNFDLIVCLMQVGGLQIELIQPLNESGDAYSDFLKEKGEGIHHIHIDLADNDHERFLSVMKEIRLKELTGGSIGGVEYFYYDLTDILGFVLEGHKGSMNEKFIS